MTMRSLSIESDNFANDHAENHLRLFQSWEMKW